MHAGLGGLDRIELIVHRGGGAGQVVDLVHFHIQGERHVVAHCLEVWIGHQMGDVCLAAGEVIIDAKNVAAICKQLARTGGSREIRRPR